MPLDPTNLVMTGADPAVSGKTLNGLPVTGIILGIVNYDNTYPAANGSKLLLHGFANF
jgi:hypothetical protein